MREILAQLETLIREGRDQKVREQLRAMSLTSIPRKFRKDTANLAYRVGLPHVSIRIMRSVVRPGGPLDSPASDEEKAEYAMALSKIGAGDEALLILSGIDAVKLPQVWLYRCGVLFSQWRYAEAIPLLKNYLASPGLDDYRRLVGQLNLAAAFLVTEQNEEAATLLETTREMACAQGFSLIHGNALELSAQLEMFSGHPERADVYLSQGAEIFKGSSGLWEFFIRKWQAVADAMKRKADLPSALEPLQKIRQEALLRKHWETIRECDFLTASLSQDRHLLLEVYFGTPYQPYRLRIMRAFGAPVDIPESFISGSRAKGVFDLVLGAKDGSKNALFPNQLIYRLLRILGSDSYRPFQVGTLFSRLFPDEYFNPDTSPDRVYQLVRRLRQWIDQEDTGLRIDEFEGEYRLAVNEGYGLRQRLEQDVTGNDVLIVKLKEHWPANEFSAKDGRELLSVSNATLNRILKKAVEDGRVVRIGKSRNTRYRFAA